MGFLCGCTLKRLLFLSRLGERYCLVAEVVQVRQLDPRFVEEDAFEYCVVLTLFLFQSVVHVDPAHL
jgi:hypothetical protein